MTRSEMPSANRKLHIVGYYKLSGRVLGKGNFARVEEATHSILFTKVAIKIIDTTKIKEEYVIRNLEREAHILARLSHPSIQCLYETMRTGSIYYLVTELATGGDLCTYIKRQQTGRLEEKVARRFGRQLISALVHMHNRGVVHRDLKMENIMLDATKDNIKIVDFGLSNNWNPEIALKTHCGSPEYAAPELFIVGHSYGPEVDLWSLGVILYGMVTGRLPFVTPRNEDLSPTEKRRLLLTQINRGLTHHHRKALSCVTIEFRNMVGRLLVPNVQKRMPLKELMFHPWVMLNRQNMLMTDFEYTKLTPYEHTSIMKRISRVLRMEDYRVELEMEGNHFGKLGGMYNILAHMQFMVNRELDGISWSSTSPSMQTLSLKDKNKSRSHSVGRQKMLAHTCVQPQHKSYGPVVDIDPRPKSAAQHHSQVIKTQIRPRTSVQHNSSSYSSTLTTRRISSCSSRRKSPNKAFEPRRPKSPPPHAVRMTWNEELGRLLPQQSSLRVVGSRGVPHNFNQRQGSVGAVEGYGSMPHQEYCFPNAWGNMNNNQNLYSQHYRRIQEQQQKTRPRPLQHEQRCSSAHPMYNTQPLSRLRNRPNGIDVDESGARSLELSRGDRYWPVNVQQRKAGKVSSCPKPDSSKYGNVITDSSITTSTSSSGSRDCGEVLRPGKRGNWFPSSSKSGPKPTDMNPLHPRH